jgi:tetratricopeptide (TPR) repeat protein
MSKKELDAVREARRLSQDAWESSALAKARSILEQALAADEDDNLLLTCLGAVLSDQGHHLDAAKLLKKAVANGSKDRNTYFNLGVAVLNSGTHEEAMEWFKKANSFEVDPESWEAYFDPQAH